jgi:hypothetical protein
MNKHIYEEAKNRVKKKKKFRDNLSSFIVWGGAMLFINLFITRGYMWSLWVIFFWGLSVLKEAFDIYGLPGGNSEDWEEREIEKEMERIKRLGDGSERAVFEEDDLLEENESVKPPSTKWNEDDLV